MMNMLGYYVFLAWKSIRRTPGNSLIVVAGIALGVAIAALFSIIHQTYARDPIPHKSSVLHYVRMDSWDPQKAYEPDGIPPQITYRDMLAIMKSDIPVRQTASFYSLVRTNQGHAGMFRARFCHRDFFEMFDIPFRFGSSWTREDDERAAPVVILNEEQNIRWFGGENSVGKLVNIEGRDFRVVGVLGPFRPWIRFYDLTTGYKGMTEFLYMPLDVGVTTFKKGTRWSNGDSKSWKPDMSYEDELLTGENVFLQMWVELKDAQGVVDYQRFLDDYALEQRRVGRFLRPLDNRVTPLLQYMRERGCTPPEARGIMIAANLFLVACALSLTSLLLSRFLARSAEVGVRRAFGARGRDIFVQHVIECEMMAILGGMFGLGLAQAGLYLVNAWFVAMKLSFRADVFRLDFRMSGFAIGISVVVGLFAALYPAYRVSRIQPALQLKIQ